jgi:branched-chain amino acid transport system substrate-binding protein
MNLRNLLLTCAMTTIMLTAAFSPIALSENELENEIIVERTAANTVKIGLLSPQTGPIAVYADGFEDAAAVAIAQLNEADPDNWAFELVVADSGCDGTVAATAAQSLIDAGVAGIAGAACSGATLGAIAVAKEAGVPMVSYASTSPAVTTADDSGYLWRVVPSDAMQAVALADLVEDSDAMNVGVLYMTNDYGSGLADNFDAEYNGDEDLCAKIGYDQDSTDFASTVESLAASDCDGVLLVSYATDGAAILEEMALQGVDMNLFGADGVADSAFFDSFSDSSAADDLVATKPSSAGDSDASIAFATAYADAGGDASGIYTAETFDAVLIIGDSVMAANSSVGADVNTALATVGTDYEGASGTHTFDENGDVLGSGYEICEFFEEEMDCEWRWDMGVGLSYTGYVSSVTIGLLSPQTGPIAVYSSGFETAASVAVAMFDEMPDFDVELVVADSGCDGTAAATAAQSLIDAGVDVIVGAACSGATLGAIAVAKEAGVPMISYASTSPAITTADDNGHLFRVVPSDDLQARALADAVKASGYTSPAVIYMTNDYGSGLADFFNSSFDGEVCSMVGYDQDTTDFASTVESVASAGCDSAVLISYATDGAAILEEMAIQSLDIGLFGADGVADSAFGDAFSDITALDGLVATKPRSGGGDAGMAAMFALLYAAAGGDEGGIYTAETFDATVAAIMLASALESGLPLNMAVGMLIAEPIEGASGTHAFDANGDVAGNGYDVCIFAVDGALACEGTWISGVLDATLVQKPEPVEHDHDADDGHHDADDGHHDDDEVVVDEEKEAGGLPGFTSILAITAMMGAAMIAMRRD